jgi:hypothetical protein
VETKLIELYLLICRLYDTKPALTRQRLSNNHQPRFSDEELLTIYLFGHLQGLTTRRRIYDYIHNHWREWFPTLPSYQTVFARLFQSRVESALLRQTRRRLFIAHFLLLIRINYLFRRNQSIDIRVSSDNYSLRRLLIIQNNTLWKYSMSQIMVECCSGAQYKM